MLLLVIRKLFPSLVTHCAGNGKAGWAMFQEHTPEVVITDLNMPEMDGLQMARMIRAHTPATKLIALSAHIERTAQDEPGLNGQVFDYVIVKPSNSAFFLARSPR